MAEDLVPLQDLKFNMVVDTSQAHAALDEFVDAVKLADDTFDSTGRRTTAVDALITETIAGNTELESMVALVRCDSSAAWEAVARDLARQVINAETEIAELDEAIEAEAAELADTETDAVAEQQAHCETYIEAVDLAEQLARTTASRDSWRSQCADLYVRLEEDEQAHCDTYVEAVRLSAELAGWQNSSHAEYRRSTAARRLEAYQATP